MAARGPRHEPRGVVVILPGGFRAREVPAVLAAVRRSLPVNEPRLVIGDAARLAHPDACTVDALARLALRVRRLGLRLFLRQPSPELRELLTLAGLTEVIPWATSAIEPIGQAEAGEEPGRVEEERDARDPTA